MARLVWNHKEPEVRRCEPRLLERWGEGGGGLIHGDCLAVMDWVRTRVGIPSLAYLDPPFASGRLYGRQTAAYDDRWEDMDAYLSFLVPRLEKVIDTLSENGSLFVHLDWHAVHYVRVVLDELLGPHAFLNEIVWHYYNKFSRGRGALPRAHDTILWYAKGRTHVFNEVRAERQRPVRQLRRVMVNGRLVNARDSEGRLQYQEVRDFKVDDVWTIPQLQPASGAWTGYPTQKHPALLEMLVLMASMEGDLVLDPFCGSGTTLIAAHLHGRPFVGIDSSAVAIAHARAALVRAGVPFALYGCDELDTSPPFQGGATPSRERLGWAVGHFNQGVFVPQRWNFNTDRVGESTEIEHDDGDEVRIYYSDGTITRITR